MPNTEQLVTGLLAGLGVVLTWEALPPSFTSQFALNPNLAAVQQSSLAFIEHYHVGMAFTLTKDPVGQGLGLALIGSEFLQQNPFGIGKLTISENIGVASVLAGLLAVRYG